MDYRGLLGSAGKAVKNIGKDIAEIVGGVKSVGYERITKRHGRVIQRGSEMAYREKLVANAFKDFESSMSGIVNNAEAITNQQALLKPITETNLLSINKDSIGNRLSPIYKAARLQKDTDIRLENAYFHDVMWSPKEGKVNLAPDPKGTYGVGVYMEHTMNPEWALDRIHNVYSIPKPLLESRGEIVTPKMPPGVDRQYMRTEQVGLKLSNIQSVPIEASTGEALVEHFGHNISPGGRHKDFMLHSVGGAEFMSQEETAQALLHRAQG